MTRFLPLLVAVLFSVGVGAAFSQSTCGGTVNITIPAATTVYNVEAAGAINDTLRDCDDKTLVINLEYLGDTLKLSNEIIVTSRPDSSTTSIIGKGKTGPLIITENSLSDPMMLDVRLPATTILSNFHFVRRVDNSSVHSVVVAAKGSIIRDCHFYRADAGSLASGALLSVTADSVLVERSLFRAPPNGKGRAIAISASGGANRNEYRSNIFYSTGLLLNGTSFHIYANTFAGSRDEYNAIIIGSGITSGSAVGIEHNLFALKADTLPPIHFAATVPSSDAILKNAYSRSRPIALAVHGPTAQPVTLIAPGASNNDSLPRGFSRYAPWVQSKEYPLVQLRTDSLLLRSDTAFGRIPNVYSNLASTWTNIPDISLLPASKLWFPEFRPFIAARTWQPGIKVGALVDLDPRQVPSPLDSGAYGKGITIVRDPTDSTIMRVSAINFNAAYYDTLIPPSEMLFFFSNTPSRLNGTDSNSLKNPTTGTPYYTRVPWLNFSNTLAVPREVRNGGNIYVKMLHYNTSGQAPLLSVQGPVAQVTGIPSYPINDLSVPALDPTSTPATGKFVMVVTKVGPEAIDSIRITAINAAGGGTQEVQSRPAPARGATVSITFQLPRGQFQFHATPVARVGTSTQAGQATALTEVFNSNQLASDTAYVTRRMAGCPGLGTKVDPFCTIDLALAELRTKQAGTILVQNGTPALPFDTLLIGGADSFAVTITVPVSGGAFDPVHRAVFRGTAGVPALTISRRNVNLKGFIFEMPPGAAGPAVHVASGGVTIDGCLFRPVTTTGLAGTGITIETPGNQEMRFISNLIWGYATGVRINSASSGIRILHNTFFDDVQVFPAGSTGISAHAGAVEATIANNYFSGSAAPLDAGFAGKTPRLVNNAYSTHPPPLQGLAETGTLDSLPRLRSVDFTRSDWPTELLSAMEGITECSEVRICYGLYAGSSSDPFGPAIVSDVMGKARLGKPEVGAFEAAAAPTSVRGLIQVNVSPLRANEPDADNRLPFTVVRKSLDPADVDSLHVWWATGPNVSLTDAILKANQIHYSIDKLTATGTLQDTATGLDPDQTYYVYAALGKTTSGVRTLGYKYRHSGTTQTKFSDSACKVSSSRVCPSDGFFRESTNGYLTQVTFSRPDSIAVEVPEFTFPNPRVIGKVDFNSPMPNIKFTIHSEEAKVAGSRQSWKATIRMLVDPGDNVFKGKDLFILPPDSNSLPRYVPTWEVRREGADVFLIIEGYQNGTFTYAFGSAFANPLVESGKFSMTTPPDKPLTFSFKGVKDSASLAFSIKGSGFSTANPMVMITPVPAGGTLANPLDPELFNNPDVPEFNKSIFLSHGLSDLHDSLRRALMHSYYVRAVSADSATEPQVGQPGKPFRLSPVDAGDFAKASLVGAAPINVSAGGETDEIPITMPVFVKYKDGQNYTDRKERTSRSLEVVFTVFDGARVSRSNGYIRTEFTDSNLVSNEKEQFEPRVWNLFSYPWAEADTGSLARILKASDWKATEMRLMKYKGSGKEPKDFLIYDGTNPQGFSFDSGHAVWSGNTTQSTYRPICLSGASLDYQTFTLNLAAGVWNDFGLPFNFPIKWKDILNASALTGAEFTTWRYRPAAKNWEELSATSVIHPWQGLTAKPSAAVALKFPVLDSSRSMTALAKQAAGDLWSARVEAWNGTALMSLRIGKASSEAVSPEPPDVPGQDFRIGLRRLRPEGEETLSRHLQTGEDWRGHWSLSGTASGQAIRLAVADNARETPLYLIETLTRKAIPLAKGTEVVLSPEDLKSGDYHLVAGDSRYVEDILNGMVPLHMLALSNYPNPFSGSTLIRYALPETFGKVEFRMKIRDSKGRMVWEKTQRGGNSLRHLWDGRDRGGKQAGAGFYTLEVEAHAPGKTPLRAVRRLLKM